MILIDKNGDIYSDITGIWKQDSKAISSILFDSYGEINYLKEGISNEEAENIMLWIHMQVDEQRNRRNIIIDLRKFELKYKTSR